MQEICSSNPPVVKPFCDLNKYWAQHHHTLKLDSKLKYLIDNVLLKLIKDLRPDIDKIYLYVKDLYKSKHQLLINGREKVGIKKLKNPKPFIDY